jgi:Na+/H+-dicarboxylate symporter
MRRGALLPNTPKILRIAAMTKIEVDAESAVLVVLALVVAFVGMAGAPLWWLSIPVLLFLGLAVHFDD